MSAHVVVLGGGVAGTAAAFAAANAGASVTVVLGGVGASSLYGGAVDDHPWDELERAARQLGAVASAAPLADGIGSFAEALGVWQFPEVGSAPARIATTTGVVRSARAHDHAILDLGRLAGRTVLVPRAERAGWDADSLVRCLRDSALTAQGTTFEVAPSPVLRFDEERDIVDIDLAARHDDRSRLAWLAERLAGEVRAVGAERAAVLLGPWLGAARSRAAELSALLGVPAGEALAATAGTAGVRFEAARGELLARIAARSVASYATVVEAAPRSGRRRVTLRIGDPLEADAVVLVTGGLIGGGVVFDPPEHGAGAEGAARIHPALRSAVEIEDLRVTGGGDHGFVGSMHGPVLDDAAWPARGAPGWLERAGIVGGRDGQVSPGIYCAGDAIFGARRTMLLAIGSALAAGAAAALHARTAALSLSTSSKLSEA